jgi:hypothetical protein
LINHSHTFDRFFRQHHDVTGQLRKSTAQFWRPLLKKLIAKCIHREEGHDIYISLAFLSIGELCICVSGVYFGLLKLSRNTTLAKMPSVLIPVRRPALMLLTA